LPLHIFVGTPLYRKKYDNKEPMQGFVITAECDLIGKRMIGTEDEKEGVLPVLLEGASKLAFPPLFRGRVYADFSKNEDYFNTMFELLMSLYQLPPQHSVYIGVACVAGRTDGAIIHPTNAIVHFGLAANLNCHDCVTL
jgi:hypothetical protein